MITVVCWCWSTPGYRSKFTSENVTILYNMVKRNTTVPFRFVCMTDEPERMEAHTPDEVECHLLWPNPAPAYGGGKKPNCFVRLRSFAPEAAEIFGERFIWFDLDCVITGNIDHLLQDKSEFRIWCPDFERMPCNGSLLLHKTGTRRRIWERFHPSRIDPEHGLKRASHLTGSDQAWIALNLKPIDKFFKQVDGIYSYRSHLPANGRLPEEARVVFFNGKENPWSPNPSTLPWVQEHYR